MADATTVFLLLRIAHYSDRFGRFRFEIVIPSRPQPEARTSEESAVVSVPSNCRSLASLGMTKPFRCHNIMQILSDIKSLDPSLTLHSHR